MSANASERTVVATPSGRDRGLSAGLGHSIRSAKGSTGDPSSVHVPAYTCATYTSVGFSGTATLVAASGRAGLLAARAGCGLAAVIAGVLMGARVVVTGSSVGKSVHVRS